MGAAEKIVLWDSWLRGNSSKGAQARAAYRSSPLTRPDQAFDHESQLLGSALSDG
jgi:hypothetical protein